MSSRLWDNTGVVPDLMRLPLHIREGMTQTIPHRPDECHVAFMAFQQTPGLNHPNARMNVSLYRKAETNSAISIADGAQLDFLDFTGRLALATTIVDKTYLSAVIASMLRVYAQLGGDVQAVFRAADVVREAEDTPVAFFEERSDD